MTLRHYVYPQLRTAIYTDRPAPENFSLKLAFIIIHVWYTLIPTTLYREINVYIHGGRQHIKSAFKEWLDANTWLDAMHHQGEGLS